MHLRGTGTFRPVSPVVFVSLAEGISRCEQLAKQVRRGPLEVGLAFPYHPHVTIAHHLSDPLLDRAFEELADFECRFDVAGFHLYVHDDSQGWRPTHHFPLAAGTERRGVPAERLPRALAALRERRPLVDHAVRTQAALRRGEGRAAGRGGHLLRLPVALPDPGAVVLRRRLRCPGLPRGTAQPAGRDQPAAARPDRRPRQPDPARATSRTPPAPSACSACSASLYTGLGWLSAMRDALAVVFELPAREQPNFVLGKLRDLSTLALVGVALLVSVAVSGLRQRVRRRRCCAWLGLGTGAGAGCCRRSPWCSGWPRTRVLFFALFRLLAEPRTPTRSLWQGALLGAVGFEVLKRLSGVLLASTKGQPAFQAFGIALILLVWINYFSRVVLYAAAWAHTSRAARAQRYLEPADPIQGPQSPPLSGRRTAGPVAASYDAGWRLSSPGARRRWDWWRSCAVRARRTDDPGPQARLAAGRHRRMERLHLDHVRQEPLRRLPRRGRTAPPATGSRTRS